MGTPLAPAVDLVTEGSRIRLADEFLYTIPVPVRGFGFGLAPGVPGGETPGNDGVMGEWRLDIEFE
jgi:hypothetical protein